MLFQTIRLFVLAACCPSIVSASIYDFTLNGSVTQSTWPSIGVGDPFTIHYTADAKNVSPYADRAYYLASMATAYFPNSGITIPGYYFEGFVTVFQNFSGHDRVLYDCSHPTAPEIFQADFWFPRGTLASLELPLTLPLQSASQAVFVADVGQNVTGNISSYTAVETPEPIGFTCVYAGGALALSARRWRNQPLGSKRSVLA